MIIVDIETTGLHTGPFRNDMVSLGAVDFETGEEFYGECKAHPDGEISQYALDLNGFTIEQVRDPNKQLPIELIDKFIKWSAGREQLLAGHNIGSFDIKFIKDYHDFYYEHTTPDQKHLVEWPFGFRYIDLHSVAYAILGKSLSMDSICDELGIEREVMPHNALNGAKKEAECFKLLLSKDFQYFNMDHSKVKSPLEKI